MSKLRGRIRDPVRNRWIRGIPLCWRLIDASFGRVAFLSAWLGHRWTGRPEARAAVYTAPA